MREARPPGYDESRSQAPAIESKGWVSLRQFTTLMEVTYHCGVKWKREKRFWYYMVGGQVRITEEEVRYCLTNGTRAPGTAGNIQEAQNLSKDSSHET